MIFRNLTLHDYGVFSGRVSVDLTPHSKERPVVLFGGLNGRGKTTILDAIQLVLFGQRARISNRGTLTWEEYLREAINRSAAGEASVTLEFEVPNEFSSIIYRVVRSWQISGKKVKESFDVAIDGRPDKLLSTQWDEHIETLLPARVAALNFFDGEKIESLADPLQSREVFRSAIENLLGVGLLDKLNADLKTYLRKTEVEAIAELEHTELRKIESELGDLDAELASLAKEHAHQTTLKDRTEELLRRVVSKAEESGSTQWSNRAALEDERKLILEASREYEDALLLLVAGPEPLKLLGSLIDQTIRRAEFDRQILLERELVKVLATRDAELLEQVDEKAKKQITFYSERDFEKRGQIASQNTVFITPEILIAQLSELQTELSAESDIAKHLAQISAADRRIIEIDRILQTVPTDDTVIPLIEERAKTQVALETINAALKTIDERTHETNSKYSRLKSRYEKVLAEEADAKIKDLDQRRSRDFATKAIATVRELAEKTMAHNISLIEVAILEKLNILLGKENLITDLRVNPETLELKVSTGNEIDFSVDRLSAGERQILAVATLWGLSSVAGHPLPLVIDTPLGRLDSEHRKRLVENYFPNASAQVIILSTDEEIVEELHQLLEESISLEYIIEYNDETSSSAIRPGYFVGASNGS